MSSDRHLLHHQLIIKPVILSHDCPHLRFVLCYSCLSQGVHVFTTLKCFIQYVHRCHVLIITDDVVIFTISGMFGLKFTNYKVVPPACTCGELAGTSMFMPHIWFCEPRWTPKFNMRSPRWHSRVAGSRIETTAVRERASSAARECMHCRSTMNFGVEQRETLPSKVQPHNWKSWTQWTNTCKVSLENHLNLRGSLAFGRFKTITPKCWHLVNNRRTPQQTLY